MWSGYSEKGTGSQERGPGGFTFDPPGAPEARAAQGQAVGVQAGMRGSNGPGNTAPSVQIDTSTVDHTLRVLGQLGKDLIQPQIDKLREAQFLQGMTRAASGEALTGIINEQPAFSRIFGGGAVVEGAQAYEIQARTDKWATVQEQQMDTLKRKSPDDIPGYLMESMNQHLTGDAGTDAMIKGNMVKSLPGIIKRHTREHYKFVQEQASEQRVNAITAAAEALQSGYNAAPGMVRPDELDNRAMSLLATSVPHEGADPDSYEKDVALSIQLMAERGQFHALNVYKKAGVIQNMNPQTRLQVEKLMDTAGAQQARRASEEYAEQIAKIRFAAHNGMMNAEQVKGAFEQINLDSSRKTGNTEHQVITKAEEINTMMSAEQALMQATKQGIKAAAGAKTDAAQTELLYSVFARGDAGAALVDPDMKDKDVHRSFYAYWDSLKGKPDAQAALLATNAQSNYGNPQIKQHFTKLINSGPPDAVNEGFREAARQFRVLATVGGAQGRVLTEYFEPKDLSRMQAYDETMRRFGDKPEMAEYAFAQTKTIRRGGGYSADEKKQAVSIAKDVAQTGSWYQGLPLVGAKMDAHAVDVITDAMAPFYEQLKGHGEAEDNMKNALEYARQNGLDTVGTYAWTADKGKRKLHEVTSLTPKELAPIFNELIKERVTAVTNKTPDATAVLRVEDNASGHAQFQVFTMVDGVPTVGTELLTSEDIKQRHLRNKAQAVRHRTGLFTK